MRVFAQGNHGGLAQTWQQHFSERGPCINRAVAQTGIGTGRAVAQTGQVPQRGICRDRRGRSIDKAPHKQVKDALRPGPKVNCVQRIKQLDILQIMTTKQAGACGRVRCSS